MSKASYAKWYENNKEAAREKKRIAMRRYRRENPGKHAIQSREAKRKLRRSIFSVYGTVCVICGFSDQRALTLDHILNNGAEERKTLGERGVYRRALEPQYRHEYRILCMNRQFIQRAEHGRQNQHSHGDFLEVQ